MLRRIVLKKEIDNRYIEGYFIEEKNSIKYSKDITTIQKVKGDKLTNRVKYLEKIEEKGLIADDFINKHDDFYKSLDKITEHKSTGFRIIDNIKNEVIGCYNWN